MAVGNTYTATDIDWNKVSTSINVSIKAGAEVAKFGHTMEQAASAFSRLHDAYRTLSEDPKERERKRRAVRAMRPFMDLLTDPKVMFLRRWANVERPLYVDGSSRGYDDYMQVDPNWLVTIGVAVNIETREVEFWMSSPTSTLCWNIDVELNGGSIDHLMTPTSFRTLETKWIEVLADLAESDGEFRFTNDRPEPLTEQEAEAVRQGRRDSLADILKDAEVIDQWVKEENWSRAHHPLPFTPGSPPGTYKMTSGDSNLFNTIMDSVTTPAPKSEALTVEKMMDLSKQIEEARKSRNSGKEFFSVMNINTTA